MGEITGCPFADAFLAGLRLTPRLDCGPAHLDGAKLIYDAELPVWKQLLEIAEQTAKWRNRRGLHIVRPSLLIEGPDNEMHDVPGSDRVLVANTNRTSRRQRLRTAAAPTAAATGMQGDEPGMHLRHARKLPLGV